MSERLDHEEDLPVIRLKGGDTEYELTPENSALYVFLGRLACYSHVFMETARTDDQKRRIGNYIFSNHSVFNEIANFMSSRGYPMHVNLREVEQCDIDAFDSFISQQAGDIGDTIPNEFFDDENPTT